MAPKPLQRRLWQLGAGFGQGRGRVSGGNRRVMLGEATAVLLPRGATSTSVLSSCPQLTPVSRDPNQEAKRKTLVPAPTPTAPPRF